MTEEPKEGSPAGMAYVVRYDEDQWMKYDEKGQEYCKSYWIKRAMPMRDIEVVCLQLIPDTLFPSHGHERPYIAWQHRLERDEPSKVKCCTACGRPL